ncbi:carboxypeptidase inhibitor precursor [Bombyx mori]|uniref:Carboxypeptidase inhibitor n=1 Tax=Bombyx mori TaxID=7091 RepID=Q1HQ32_BOMMO|nr:carboxypeptidase inhibitor precursor [Bombyx mori]ABF51309.1 carboxypeptidase inhibitor [Bombyx mori]
MKFLLFCAMCILVYGNSEDDFCEIDSIEQEDPCRREGGLCTVAEDCPSDIRARTGLCPKQQKDGIECCYGVSVKETRCRKHGGECFSKGYCSQSLIYEEASDCPEGNDCCILV